MGKATGPSTILLRLELDVGEDPIRGRVEGPAGDASNFSGWLELIGALERLRGHGGEPPPKVFGGLHDAEAAREVDA